jgi:acetyltransferase-like isoleucine patch superfamily enzyme
MNNIILFIICSILLLLILFKNNHIDYFNQSSDIIKSDNKIKIDTMFDLENSYIDTTKIYDKVKVGNYSYSANKIQLWHAHEKLEIGKFCSIARNLKIYLGGNHRYDWITTYPFGLIHQDVFSNMNANDAGYSNGNVTIGNDVWIGDNVTIMSGITIGDGCVIANNSHVVKNTEPYSIIGGNPAKLIKYRFTPEQINKLLKIKWWNWDETKINNAMNVITNSDIDLFINKYFE